MGTNDKSAGETQVFKIMIATFRFVIYIGYFNGFTIAKYLKENRKQSIDNLTLCTFINGIVKTSFKQLFTYQLIYSINVGYWQLKNTHPSYSTRRT